MSKVYYDITSLPNYSNLPNKITPNHGESYTKLKLGASFLGFISAKDHWSTGLDDNAGFGSTAYGTSAEVDSDGIGKAIKRVLGQSSKLRNVLDKFPAVEKAFKVLDSLPVEIAASLEVEALKKTQTGDWHLQVTLNGEVSLNGYEAIKNTLINTKTIDKSAFPKDEHHLLEFGRKYSCSITVPMKEIADLSFDKSKFAQGLMTNCYNAMRPSLNLGDASTHTQAAQMLQPYLSDGWSYAGAKGTFWSAGATVKAAEAEFGNTYYDTLIVTQSDGHPALGYYPALAFDAKARWLLVEGEFERRAFSPEGTRGVNFGTDDADAMNARKLGSYLMTEMYNMWHQNPMSPTVTSPITKQYLQYLVDTETEAWKAYYKARNITELPLEMQVMLGTISASFSKWETDPVAAMSELYQSKLQPRFEGQPPDSPLIGAVGEEDLPLQLRNLRSHPSDPWIVEDFTSLPVQDTNALLELNGLLGYDATDPASLELKFEGPVVVPIAFAQSDDLDLVASNPYYFVVTGDNEIAVDGFENFTTFNQITGFERLPGFDECAEKFGYRTATMLYSNAIRQYEEQSAAHSDSQTPVPLPERRPTLREIKQEVVQGDNPGLSLYYQKAGPQGVSYYQYFYPDITDRSGIDSATERTRVELPTKPSAQGQIQVRTTERKVNGQWTLTTTTETRSYDKLTVVKVIQADDPEHFDLDVVINTGAKEGQSLFNSSVTAGQLGAKLGSTLGGFVSGDDVWKKLSVSPMLETLGENLFEAGGVDLVRGRGDLSDDVLDAFANFDKELLGHVRDSAGGVVGSLLTAELMRAIDAEGLAAELGSSVSNAVLGQISRNMLTIGVNELTSGATTAALGDTKGLLNGIDLNLVGNAIGSFVGSKLAEHALAGFDSEEEALGAQIGGAAASIATMFLVSSGPVGWLITGLAAFAGNFLGGTVGDLIHSAMPEKASAQLKFNSETGEFEIAQVWKKRGGNVDGVKALANVASDAMENVLGIVGGDVINSDSFSGLFTWKVSKNLNGPGYFEKGSYFENKGGFGLWHNGVEDFNAVVEGGVIDMLSRLEVAGGDLYAKRALYNSLPQLFNENNKPIEDPLKVLAGNLQIAQEYRAYQKSKELINALIAAQPGSTFAAGWIATLARAAELGLNRRHAADFYGGWRYFLEQSQASVTQSELSYSDNGRQIALENDQTGIVLDDNVDSDSKTTIVGSGVIDLRESARELLGNLRKDGDLLINSQGVVLPEAYQDLRQEDNEIWLGDRLIATLGSAGVGKWHGSVDIDLLIYLNSLAKDLVQGSKQLVDGLLYDIVAEVADDGTLIPTTENAALDGAMLQGDELIREGSVIATMDGEGQFTATHGDNISVAAMVYGSEKDDIIYSGDEGNDISAGDGNDTVHGGANADWMYGGEGDDILNGGDADGNALFGEAGNDELHGGAGSDWLEGGLGDDQLYGGDGGDILQGNAGSDYLEGGLGGDIYVFRHGDGDNTIADNGAASTTTTSPSLPIVRTLGQMLQLPDGSAQDQYNEDDQLSFGPQISLDDLTYERSDDDLLVHIAGVDDDTQETLTLSDWFTDTGRIETLEFADGLRIPIAEIKQFINGTAENDKITFADTDGPALINALAGDDTIDLRNVTANAQDPTSINASWISGSVLPIGSQPSADSGHVLNGGEGNDTLYGSAAVDVLLGGSGDDVMEGADRDDVLLGGVGKDDLKGGAGDDILMGNADEDQLDGGAGGDYLMGGVGDDQLNGGAGSDRYAFGYGDGQDSLNDAHVYEPEDAKLTTLLESLDSLIADINDADGTGLGTPPPVSGVLIIPAPGELETSRLLALMNDLKPIVESATGSGSESQVKALRFLSHELEQNETRIDRAALDRFAQEFRYLVLDAAGLLDIVDWSAGVEVGDIAVGWEGDDLLLQLQSELSDDTAEPDSLRLQEWGTAAPYIERFDFANGQVSVADIEQWIGGSEGADQLDGSEGNDWITGGIGNDTISAGAGDDILNGNAGDDQLQGGDGDDLLNGGSGEDQLLGGSGDDILKGGSGDDLLSGGAGADQFDGGEGIDKVSYADATAGIRVYLDNGATREIKHGLNGEVHEVLQGSGNSEDRDALIKQLLEALPDPAGLIGEVADTVPLVEKLKTSFTEALTNGQRDKAVELLQGIFDGSSEILQPDERTSLLDTIKFVTQEPLPDAAGMDAFWEQVVSGLPERGTLIERISELVPTRSEQGDRLAELITNGDRAGLVSIINTWLESLYGDKVPAKAEAILALIPDELPAIRSSIENLTAANEAIDTTDALFNFTSTGLDYGAQEEDETLGSFLGSDGAALAEEQSVLPFDDLAVKLNGYIYLDAGKHDFTVTADGHFALKIGEVEFSQATSKEVSADFTAGFYRFELTYFDHEGDESLKVTSKSLADGNALDASFFYTDPLQVDPRLNEQTDDSGRSFFCYPATDEQGDYFENVEGIIGSAHNDLLWGDSGDNQLLGGDGADILRGAGGDDNLRGGAGDDRYEFGRGDGQDLVQDSAGDDTLVLGEDIAPEQLWFSRDGDDLQLSVIGTTDKLRIADWYSDTDSHVENITTATGQTLLDSQVESLVSAMSAFSPPDMGDVTFGMAQADRDSLNSVIAASWQ